jgi:hypothetical protein
VLDVHDSITSALKCAREDRKPQLVEAVTYRFRGHSMADPEEYRTKDEVAEWRERDPIQAFAKRLQDDDVITKTQFEELDEKAIGIVDEAVRFADESPFPDLDALYDDVYVFDSDVPAWWTIDERSPEVHRGEREREAGDVPHKLAEQGAAYAGVERRSRKRDEDEGAQEDESGEQAEGDEGAESDEEAKSEGGKEASGEGEPGADDAEERGGAG